jgi:hypothetical protein
MRKPPRCLVALGSSWWENALEPYFATAEEARKTPDSL